MPLKSLPTTGPVQHFITRALKGPSEAPVGILQGCCSRSHIRLRVPYGLTQVHLWFGRIIRRTAWIPRAMPARASYGPRREIFNVFHFRRDPYGAHVGPARSRTAHLRTCKGIDTTRTGKNPVRASYLATRDPHVPLTVSTWAVPGMFMISIPV